ncbi:MAG: hypothetical protein SVW02_00615 [Candidatus Nanohaloarchaea archaeon]|nr:hypothetical protein [Candidatus Nanohaloarchaea archaeon]
MSHLFSDLPEPLQTAHDEGYRAVPDRFDVEPVEDAFLLKHLRNRKNRRMAYNAGWDTVRVYPRVLTLEEPNEPLFIHEYTHKQQSETVDSVEDVPETAMEIDAYYTQMAVSGHVDDKTYIDRQQEEIMMDGKYEEPTVIIAGVRRLLSQHRQLARDGGERDEIIPTLRPPMFTGDEAYIRDI